MHGSHRELHACTTACTCHAHVGACGACMQVPGSALAASPDAYRIMFELLLLHGGLPGLRHAMDLCAAAHAAGAPSPAQSKDRTTHSGQPCWPYMPLPALPCCASHATP